MTQKAKISHWLDGVDVFDCRQIVSRIKEYFAFGISSLAKLHSPISVLRLFSLSNSRSHHKFRFTFFFSTFSGIRSKSIFRYTILSCLSCLSLSRSSTSQIIRKKVYIINSRISIWTVNRPGQG
jgi:hypothetical protein